MKDKGGNMYSRKKKRETYYWDWRERERERERERKREREREREINVDYKGRRRKEILRKSEKLYTKMYNNVGWKKKENEEDKETKKKKRKMRSMFKKMYLKIKRSYERGESILEGWTKTKYKKEKNI